MLEFTNRAKRVIKLANQEAYRFNSASIGPEHIFLALVKEGSGVAWYLLEHFGVDLLKASFAVGRLNEPASPITSTSTKLLPLTTQAKKVIENAKKESLTLNHNYVGTEHLLLSLLREQNGVVAHILTFLNLSLKVLRAETIHIIGSENERMKELES